MTNPNRIISDCVDALIAQIPGIRLIWLVGSHAHGDAVPGSDIDLNFALDYENYMSVWLNQNNRQDIIGCFGNCDVSINDKFLRLLTCDGLVIDIGVYEVSQVGYLEVSELKVLYHADGDLDLPRVRKKDYSVSYPAESFSQDQARQLETDLLVVIVAIPSMFHRRDWDAARFQLDLLRVELVKLMYLSQGMRYASRYKHLREMIPGGIDALRTSYPSTGEVDALASAYMNLIGTMSEFPFFDQDRFMRVTQNVRIELKRFVDV